MSPELILQLQAAIAYEPLTGTLTWKHPHGTKMPAGSLCGYISAQTGYRCIGFNYKSLQAHRVAWAVHTGEAPPPCLDHRNRVRHDNRWDNLRAADRSQSIMNTATRRDNALSERGLCWNRLYARWDARVQMAGVVHRKQFKDLEDAKVWVKAKRAQVFGEFRPD